MSARGSLAASDVSIFKSNRKSWPQSHDAHAANCGVRRPRNESPSLIAVQNRAALDPEADHVFGRVHHPPGLVAQESAEIVHVGPHVLVQHSHAERRASAERTGQCLVGRGRFTLVGKRLGVADSTQVGARRGRLASRVHALCTVRAGGRHCGCWRVRRVRLVLTGAVLTHAHG